RRGREWFEASKLFCLLLCGMERCLNLFALHFLKRLSLAFYGLCHSIRHFGAGGAHACHDGIVLSHAFYLLAYDLVFVFDADFTLIFIAGP
ncbi:MAG: hypothetical protein ACKVLF_07690, partial [Nitrospinaceae bacterium]